jgi:glycerol uptake facilitator-like aquaporin
MMISRRVVAEGMGAMMLVATVVGSGIMAERLSAGNIAIALLANAIATGAVLAALILALAGISGAHFNPAVTLFAAFQRDLKWAEVPGYIFAQCVGGILGVAIAHAMFAEPLFTASRHARAGGAQIFSEFVATFGLLSIIRGCSRMKSDAVALAVGAYIAGAYWFTASTSFANPAVTLARALTDTFSGIRSSDVPGFIAAQLAASLAATMLWSWLIPAMPENKE